VRYKTKALVQVAVALTADPMGRHWGYDIARKAGLRSGVVYPLLTRLYDDGWLSDGWEEQWEGSKKRPPRRYYELTDLGRRELGALLDEARLDGRFVGIPGVIA
jgi:PadR family transcriptional regulator PadR